MVDLHCHILPGLDDGPDTMEESLEMVETAIADGITHVVATPHSSDKFWFDFPQVRRLRDELQGRIGNRLKIATGCDFHLNPENLALLRKQPRQYCINQHDYLLLEFNEVSIPPAMDKTLHAMQLSGLRLIITHPERNAILRTHPERLKEWVRRGCFAQVTGAALTGGFGPTAQQIGLQWLGEGIVHFVASAAPPVARVKRIFGGCAHDNAAFCRRELSPEEPRAPRVRLAGDEDDGAILLSTERTTDYPDFVGGIHNGRFKHMNGSCGNSFMDQNAGAVDFFPFVRNSHCLQGFSRLGGVRKPHLRRVTLGVESGRFQSPH